MENLQIEQRILINFRVPETLKNTFDLLCRYEAKNRTTALLTLMRDYVSDKGPKIQRQISETTSIGDVLSDLVKPAQKSTKNGLWGNQSENFDESVHTHGNLVQDPISKTWMTEDEYRKLVR